MCDLVVFDDFAPNQRLMWNFQVGAKKLQREKSKLKNLAMIPAKALDYFELYIEMKLL